MKRLRYPWFVFCFLFLSLKVSAWTERTLDSTDPFVFTPNHLGLDQYFLDTALPWSWVPQSFEWVRIDHRFLVPRARVKIKVPPLTPVTYRGQLFTTPNPEIEIPVALSQERGNEIEILHQKIPIRFKVTHPIQPALMIDASCSSTPIKFRNLKLEHSWVGVYCNMIHPKKGNGYGLRMDMHIYWESEERTTAKLNQTELSTTDGMTYSIALNSDSREIRLENGADSFEIVPKIPEVFHPLSMSIGLGPYVNQSQWRPFATLYTSYYFNEQMKVASFIALPLKSNTETDLGLYVIVEQFRGLDERLSLNLLLGAHGLSFTSQGSHHFALSVPQGVELNFKNFLQPNQSLMFGGFFYPLISDRSYVNTWIRYGNGSFFLEFNYINWKEPVANGSFESKSMGFSVGFPLFKAL